MKFIQEGEEKLQRGDKLGAVSRFAMAAAISYIAGGMSSVYCSEFRLIGNCDENLTIRQLQKKLPAKLKFVKKNVRK